METILLTAENIRKLINQKSKPRKYKLKKDEKLDFAYKYWHLTDKELPDIYYELAKEYSEQTAKAAHEIGTFMDNQEITTIPIFQMDLFDRPLSFIEYSMKRVKNNGNWLSQYNLDREFEDQDEYNHPIIYRYLKEDKSIFTIDKKHASKVLGILIEEDVPTAKCIVTGAFPYYANDNMDEYIERFQKIKK